MLESGRKAALWRVTPALAQAAVPARIATAFELLALDLDVALLLSVEGRAVEVAENARAPTATMLRAAPGLQHLDNSRRLRTSARRTEPAPGPPGPCLPCFASPSGLFHTRLTELTRPAEPQQNLLATREAFAGFWGSAPLAPGAGLQARGRGAILAK